MAKHNELGLLGEKLAASYLIDKGYKILAANWRLGKEEVDIITEKDGMLVVVEVKTRAGEDFGDPEDAVTRKKQRSIIKATNAYMEEHDIDLEVRFDVVGVLLEGKIHSINHIEDAFQPVA